MPWRRGEGCPTGAFGAESQESDEEDHRETSRLYPDRNRPGMSTRVAESLLKIDGIKPEASSAVSGPYDVVALVEGDSHNAIGRLVVEKIQATPGVRRTLTCFWVRMED